MGARFGQEGTTSEPLKAEERFSLYEATYDASTFLSFGKHGNAFFLSAEA